MTQYALNEGDDGKVADVTIKDGLFVGPEGTDADSGQALIVKAGSIVKIEGGTFKGGKNETIICAGTLIITGGKFDQKPNEEWLASGKKAQGRADGYFYVIDAK